MLQDISPSKLDNSFTDIEIQEGDRLLHFDPQGKVPHDFGTVPQSGHWSAKSAAVHFIRELILR